MKAKAPGRLARLAAILAFLGFGGGVLAQVSTGFDLQWGLLGHGGGDSESAGFLVRGSLGQWVAGESANAAAGMQSGFWPGAPASAPTFTPTRASPPAMRTATGTPAAMPTATATPTPPGREYLPIVLNG